MAVEPFSPEIVEALIRVSPTPVVILDGDRRVRHWSRGAEQLLGWRAEEVLGRPYPPVPPVEEPRIAEAFRTLRCGEPVAELLTRCARRDGSLVTVALAAAPLAGDHGALGWVLLTLTDLTRQAAAEAALRRAREELSDFFENAAIAIHSVGPDGVVLRVNRAELELLGYRAEEVVGHRIAEFHADPAAAEDLLRRLAAGETVRDYPARLRCKDGSVRDVLVTSNVFWEDGRFVHTRCFTRDVTGQYADAAAAARLAAIVESSNDAIVGKTLDGVITSWNPAAERLFGWSAAEAIGQHITLIIPPDRRAEEDTVLATVRRGERIEHYDTVRVRKDGRLVDVSLTVSAIRDARGRIIGASKIARDITERRRIEEERGRLLRHEQEARAAAEALNRAKDAFVATISHELRTPLNAIFGWARLLQSGHVDPAATQRALAAIVNNASAQAGLIEDLIDLSRIATGQLRLELQPTDLRAVVEAALETVRPAAANKRLAVVPTLADPGPVRGAPERPQQVVWNLLMNAVKFTPSGGQIEIALRRVDGDAELVVTDSGQGIAPDMLQHVFDQFWQEDGSTTRAHGGLGLGLALVKRLVELHGGEVRAESAGKGKGATFTVRLPLAS